MVEWRKEIIEDKEWKIDKKRSKIESTIQKKKMEKKTKE